MPPDDTYIHAYCPKCGQEKYYDYANPLTLFFQICLVFLTFGLFILFWIFQYLERKNKGIRLKCDKCGHVWYQ